MAISPLLALPTASPAVAALCDDPTKVIACENSKPGSPSTEWDITGAGDPSIQGFAGDMSVNKGSTIPFKIKTNASSYRIDIYRIGYYGGNGARKVTTVSPSAPLPQAQPACIDEGNATGLLDCGNWGQSAFWAVPSTAVSGVYIARLVRADNGGSSHIIFVVRDDASTSDVLFQTSDATWQAYNDWGDKSTNERSLYEGVNGRAVKVSYNRPFRTREATPGGRDFFFGTEYPMVRWLEANGYDVTYSTNVDSDRRGALIKQHKIFVSTGHDEYWSAMHRTNVEAARDAGVNLAFFSGNSVYWKTRWENSRDASSTPYRTLVTYKETKSNLKVDPDPAWTGTWRDPRFSPPSDGGRPENALMGTLYKVNTGEFAIEVPEIYGKMRLWRNTSVATLAPGTTAVLASNTLGYEWDEDSDNGFRPNGLIRLSSTTKDVAEYLYDYGNTVRPGRATHHLTLYKAPSGALVFGGGTVQWSWGLDGDHDGAVSTPDVRMRQATVNLFADMGVQPTTLQSGLVAAAKSADTTAPTATITSPAAGATLANGSSVTVTGAATDAGGGQVGGVEVSTDGGTTWHPATGRESWTYTGSVSGYGSSSIKARATDDSGNIQGTPASIAVNVNCPCKIFPDSAIPGTASSSETAAIELGVKFRSDVDAWVTGVRFYKGTGNTGTHVGNLWTSTGTRLATATFSNETQSGWQQVSFPEAVPISANTTYIASYHAPNGRYAADSSYFSVPTISPPLRALQNGTDGGNGVYGHGAGGFPSNTFGGANYWVDVLATTTPPPDETPPTVKSQHPVPGASSLPVTTDAKVVFSEPVQPSSISFTLTDPANKVVPASVAYDGPTRTATLTPSASLAGGTTFSAVVSGVKDLAGNLMAATSAWAFRTAATPPPPGVCPCSLWDETAVPAVRASSDPTPTELGVKFRTYKDGFVDGIRFYKGPGNTGTHTGTLWTSTGTELATAVFANESTEGWQTVTFASPVAVTAGTTYLASYFAPAGRYAANNSYFSAGGLDREPLKALGEGVDGSNGVYVYGGGFPTNSFGSANYWVDVIFRAPPDVTPPSIVRTSPGAGATSVPVNSTVRATFSETLAAGTLNLVLEDPNSVPVPALLSYDAVSRTYILTPSSSLAPATRYMATASGGSDAAGNKMSPVTWSFTTSGLGACPCSIWSTSSAPSTPNTNDANPYELGVKFRTDVNGFITGIRFYKGEMNTGTHTGSLWSVNGTRLATGTFTGETTSGWQQMNFAQPVAVSAGTTYVASYTTTVGYYASDAGAFTTAGSENAPLRALANGVEGPNGVFVSGTGFPTQGYGSSNYWVDVAFTNIDTGPPTVVSTYPVDGASSVPTGKTIEATFSEPVQATTVILDLKDAGNNKVAAAGTYDSATNKVTLTPAAPLAGAAKYTATVSGAKDLAGNVMSAVSWSFTTAAAPPPPGTCPCSIWNDAVTPETPATADTNPTEVGVKFRSDANGYIYGIRFYKGIGNTGMHKGSLWSATGTLLATATFTNESSTGWQQVSFDTPVAITAGATYVASYHAPAGRYAANSAYFKTAGTSTPPLRALADGFDGGNGVYVYGPSGFPNQSAGGANYWVDVVFDSVGDTTRPSVVSRNPVPDATGVALDTKITASFSEAVAPGSVSVTLTAGGSAVSGNVTYDAPSRTATFAPGSYLTQGTTYTASAQASDLAGNAMATPATWTFTTLADGVAPQISAVTATADASGNATINWTTNEPADSKVDYGVTSGVLDNTRTSAALVTSHSVVLTGLAADRTYYYRVTSRDPAGNASTVPAVTAAPSSFTTPTRAFIDTKNADFAAGAAGSGIALTQTTDGEVSLAPAEGSEFTGAAIPATWTTAAWATGGTATVAEGLLTVDGARTGTTQTFSNNRSLEFVATFSGAANQHLGFGVDYSSSNEWVMFSTKTGGGIYARSSSGSKNFDTSIPGITLGVPHRFRIDWNPSTVVYSVDGVVKVTHNISVTTAMRPLASDLSVGGGTVSVDWLRMTPYAQTGTFTSRVFDSGSATTRWSEAKWNGDVPAGATAKLLIRTGDTATPDLTWSAWAAVPGPGTAAISSGSRYIQYQLQLTTATPNEAPVVRDVTLTYGS